MSKNENEQVQELDNLGVRFDQFIIAVNGALIAYGCKQLEEVQLGYSLVPLGLAILFWAISFYCGISSIRRLISVRIIGVFKQRDEVRMDSALRTESNKLYHRIGELSNRLNRQMFLFLYAGSLSYLVWQVLELIARTQSIE